MPNEPFTVCLREAVPFLASYLICHFTVSVVNNHTRTSSVVFKPFYFFCTCVLSLVSRGGCSWDLSTCPGFSLTRSHRGATCCGVCSPLKVSLDNTSVGEGPGRARLSEKAASFPFPSSSGISSGSARARQA